MQLDRVAKSGADCDWFRQHTNNKPPAISRLLAVPWMSNSQLGLLQRPLHLIIGDPTCTPWQTNTHTHTHMVGPELTVGPAAPVRCTQAVLSPGSGRGVCLPGSAEGLCYEIQPLTAGLLGDGPALPGNPETKHTDRAHTSSAVFPICLFAAVKALLFELHNWNLCFGSQQIK